MVGFMSSPWKNSKSIQGGNYEARISIPDCILSDLKWWSKNVWFLSDVLRREFFSLSFDSDSSLTGWGAVSGEEEISGCWPTEDRQLHINVLELKAIMLALQHFAKKLKHVNVLVRSDNKTAIACVNRQGTVRSSHLLELSSQIWKWCEIHDIFIRATYISSSENFRADRASRQYPLESEWSLSQNYFDLVTHHLGLPEIDLFASSITTKCSTFVSWVPETKAVAIDAFTISWSNLKFYAFPPFPLLLRTLRKIEDDQASGIVIAPKWPSQPWYPLYMSLLSSQLIILGPHANLLYSPFSAQNHPLSNSLVLMAGWLSAKHSN
uniref:Enzymatic polyprotein n=1 Tax=Lygus hesperus TaxID=30085 RepID=A0A0A9WIU8_LYGHE